jgi:hypothetical protein
MLTPPIFFPEFLFKSPVVFCFSLFVDIFIVMVQIIIKLLVPTYIFLMFVVQNDVFVL